MMRQYQEAKQRHPGLVVLFRMGDFYETFDADAELVARELADINGVPAKVMRSPEQIAAMKAAMAQAQQAEGLLRAAPVVSGAAKDLAQAQALAAAAPNQMAPNVLPQQ